MLNPTEYFEARPSLIKDAGQGLFAIRAIPKFSYFCVTAVKSYTPNCFKFPLFVPDNTDLNSYCVVDGEIKMLSDAPFCTSKGGYARVDNTTLLMKANDFAWEPGLDVFEYEANEYRNNLAFVLNYTTNAKCIGIVALAIKDIPVDAEVGATYGYNYWKPDTISNRITHMTYVDKS